MSQYKITVPPLHDAGRRVTTHGAVMSKGMARFYRFLSENGIPISDWSTDDGVDSCYPHLEAARAQLVKWIAEPPTTAGVATPEEMRGTLKDLDNVMKRRAIYRRNPSAAPKPTRELAEPDPLDDILDGIKWK